LVKKDRKGYRLDASARGNLGGLCDLVVDRESPLLVGNYQRKESKRRVELERFFRGI
jgi:hypothetical protein